MTRRTHLEKLITEKQRRLEKLEEKEAKLGINTSPEILTEIEDLKAEIEELKAKLETLKDNSSAYPITSDDSRRKSKPAYNLTNKQKDALRALVQLGHTWREEFHIVWHEPDILSDILDYDGNPPQISKGDIRALEREALLISDFVSDNKAWIVLTAKSYVMVDSDFE